ncbi:MAG: serine hydrolase, partial [Verrucomicrobiota bacterium]
MTRSRSILLPITLALLVMAPRDGWAASTHLPRSTPERQGVPPGALLAFVDALDRMDQVHSVMVVRHGHVVAEGWWGPHDAATPHELYSLSKSFTSTAVGLAVDEGLLAI